MNTDKYEALLLTIEKGSISAAAEQMRYTPSAISRCIQSVENELGVQILVRSKTGVRLTAAGSQLVPDIRRILMDEMLLKEHSALLARGESGTIRIGMSYPAFYPWLSAAMASFKKQSPDVEFVVRNGLSSIMLDQLQRNETDLCLISKLDGCVNWVPLAEDELVAIIPADHPLSEREAIPIAVYSDAPYLELHSYMETDNSRALGAAGIEPRSTIHVDDSSAMYPMVEAGLGIGMENRINTLGREGNFVTRSLDPPQIISIGIAYRSDILPVTHRFIDYLVSTREALKPLINIQEKEN